ncbi:hypothetical protein [Flavobacterium sp. TAB 87]|uniref:hypothetical protein n=1 Tax=Flavobacterium sp. TAB 87 TaxID=1729581 RepID=UPI00076C08D3|nr:hypothetical protein [Flavobacterium sp. TAB 87]KVV14224.1 hypothetical protein AP058_02110 [Flavobacterium sp. TAB 87]
MKQAKKLTIVSLLLFILMCTPNVFAQKKTFLENEGEVKKFEPHLRFEYGGNLGFSTTKNFNWLVGAEAGLQYYFSKKNAATLSFGYNYTFDGDAKALGYIPLKAGFKTFVQTGKIYLLGETGMGVATTNGYNGVGFLWAPTIGYITPSAYDLSIRYESLSAFESNQIIFRVAYSFKI